MIKEEKRVCCLYRVSTKGQVEKDDIPMQKQACREFAARQGWTIVAEKSEKGVSGFKLSAKDRDVMQEIQQDATLGKFDILLVFMFDRLGRRDDETPFVVEWFVRNGIDVWSVSEGQQRFDNHVDKLMNYIRYWQASEESIKTSVRTKTRLAQIVQEGRFRGGGVPYGYRLEKQGRLNKKNNEVNEILIDEKEAAVVQQIFSLYVNHGYGSQRIATSLKEQGVLTRKGENFVNCTIQNMLKNESYTGIIKSGETKSEPFPHLQIIDPLLFDRAQRIMMQRGRNFQERRVPMNTKGASLLSGNLFCGHCGARLTLTTNGKKYLRKDGGVTMTPRLRYVCYNKTRHPELCNGQTGYTSRKLDGIIEKVAHAIFEQVREQPKAELLEQQFAAHITSCQGKLCKGREALASHQRDLQSYEAEVLKVIRGESSLDAALLNKLHEMAKEQVCTTREECLRLEEELHDTKQKQEALSRQYDDMITWSDLFEESPMDVKKMILSHLFRSVKVSRDYQLEIELDMLWEQFGLSEEAINTITQRAG